MDVSDFFKCIVWSAIEMFISFVVTVYLVICIVRLYNGALPLTLREYIDFWRLIFQMFSEVKIA